MHYNPNFYRGMNPALMAQILKVDAVATTGNKGADTAKEGIDDDDDGLEDSSPSLPVKFPQMLYTILEEMKHPDVMRWSADGQAFYLNETHPELQNVLNKYFKRESSQSHLLLSLSLFCYRVPISYNLFAYRSFLTWRFVNVRLSCSLLPPPSYSCF